MAKIISRFRWCIVGLLFFFPFVNMVDRYALTVLVPTLRGPLGLDSIHYSYVYTAFLSAYTVGYLFCGQILDRVGVKLGLGAALACWSLISLSHAFVASWIGLVVLRFFLGLAESFNAPGGVKALGEWIPPRERSLCVAIFSNGNAAGQIIATPLVIYLALHYGWRWAFVATGVLGGFLLLGWWRWYDSPEHHPRLGDAERNMILLDRDQARVPGERDYTIRELLRQPLWIGFFSARFLTDAVSFFFAGWLPDYFVSGRGISLATLGFIGWLPYVLGDLGGIGGGAASDWLIRRGWTSIRARSLLMLAVVCFMPLANVAARTGSLTICVLLVSVMYAGQTCWMANQLALLSECYPRKAVGTMLSISAIGGSLGGVVATLITGRAVHAMGYVPVFSVMSVLHPLAFLILGFFLWRSRRPARRLPVIIPQAEYR